MNWEVRRKKLREILASDVCIGAAAVYDPISARIAEELGFELNILGGSVATLAILGAPNIAVITLSDLAELTLRITRAASVPLLVDADDGYGNAVNVVRTVEELELAGAAAIIIEDTKLPQPFGTSETILVEAQETAAKMRAALYARTDPSLVIIARTTVIESSNIADIVDRCKAYAGAGADALFIVGLKNRTWLETLSAVVNIPIILAGYPVGVDQEYLKTLGVRVALTGHRHQPILGAIEATYRALKALRDGVHPSDLPDMASKELMRKVTKLDDYQKLMDNFLR